MLLAPEERLVNFELYSGILIEERFSYIRRRGSIIGNALDSNKKPGSSPDGNHCVVFLGKTLYYHLASRHSGVLMGTGEFNPARSVTLLHGG